MNSSAKFTFSLLAAAALGAAVVACTVSSGTIDDTDGGTNTSSGTNGGTSSGNVDSGADANQPATCSELTYGSDIESAECQACLNQNCCAVTAACWNVADDSAALLGCESYVDQLNACDAETETDPNECKRATAESATQPGIPEKYNAYLSCRNTNCDATCNREGVAPDGGAQ